MKMRVLWPIGVVVMAGCLAGAALAAEQPANVASLEHGFHLLYDLDFEHAHEVFSAYQQQNPGNPMGPACEAVGLLFSEFNRLGVLESQFYQDDKTFQARDHFTPDSQVKARFDAALDRAENGARTVLGKDGKNRDALFAMTLASGLRADYAALIEKRNLASLRFTKQATAWAQQLLAVDPQCYDAHLATGVSQYIVGSMSAPVRWLVRLGGVNGDKQAGIQELQVTASHGQYLAPFARILLAIAFVREKDKPRARELLVALQNDFPQNPLFAREISRLDTERCCLDGSARP
ncbi:MAG: hypothetical protein ACRD3L_10710 [Terriglobales bacterium]